MAKSAILYLLTSITFKETEGLGLGFFHSPLPGLLFTPENYQFSQFSLLPAVLLKNAGPRTKRAWIHFKRARIEKASTFLYISNNKQSKRIS